MNVEKTFTNHEFNKKVSKSHEMIVHLPRKRKYFSYPTAVLGIKRVLYYNL